MALINTPINCHDVEWRHERIWCCCQALWHSPGDGGDMLICTAHIDEGRVFTCGFTGPDDPEIRHCSDFGELS